MSPLISYFYDKIMANAEEACLKQWRNELLQNVSGDILEIGAGTGANLKYYPNNILSLLLSEPNDDMRKQLKNKINASSLSNINVTSCSAEQLNAEDNSYDYVISTLVFCSVTDINDTFSEIKRILRPGGRLVFLEHVAAEVGTSRRIWQHRLNPFWRRLAGNCHLIRETESEIKKAGFEIESIKRESMRKTISIVRPTIRGIAVKP